MRPTNWGGGRIAEKKNNQGWREQLEAKAGTGSWEEGACCSDGFQPGVNSPRFCTFPHLHISTSTTSLSGF